ncbi:MAG TPA: hypothetical protein VNT30_05805 [Stellaceae bacterium]|nr:hypothetical protein [Stellaceae bacterium]
MEAGNMADAFVIETTAGTAGIVAADGIAFRFYASQPPFFVIEGCCFASPADARRSAEAIAETYLAALGHATASALPWRRLRRHGTLAA